MFCVLKTRKYILPMFQNKKQKKQVILLMIPNGENLHYLAIKILSAMLRVITSKHDGDFYSLKLELITEK